jgi:carbon monoxide dehydrogenase subunit G
MQLKGQKTVEASPAVCFQLLTDPEVLVRTMPGLKKMEPMDDGTYQADMEMGVAAIRGKYSGTMELRDVVPDVSYHLLMKGQGPGGFVDIDLAVSFAAAGSGCNVVYEGEAKVGGTVAGVGQRMISGVASFIMNQFFNRVAEEAKKVSG